MKMRNGKRLFQCFYCWYSTTDPEALKLHKKLIHPKGVIPNA